MHPAVLPLQPSSISFATVHHSAVASRACFFAPHLSTVDCGTRAHSIMAEGVCHTFAVAWQPSPMACFLRAPFPRQPFGASKHELAGQELFMGAISHGTMLTIAYSCAWLAAGSSSMTLVKGCNVPVSTTLCQLGVPSVIIPRPCTRCWRAHPDLNQGPADLQSAALAAELCTLCEDSYNCSEEDLCQW